LCRFWNMTRIGITAVGILFSTIIFSQKLTFGLQYSFKDIHLQHRAPTGTSNAVKFNSGGYTNGEGGINLLPNPFIQYEFKSRIRAFSDFSMTIRDSEKRWDNFLYQHKTRINIVRFGVEYPLLVIKQRQAYISAALGVATFNAYQAQPTTPFEIDVQNILDKTQPVLTINAGVSYHFNYSLAVFCNAGTGILNAEQQEAHLKGFTVAQLGARYSLGGNLFDKKQFSKKYFFELAEVSTLKRYFSFSVGADAWVRIKQEGAQHRFMSQPDPNQFYWSYDILLNKLPEIKTFPTIGFSLAQRFKKIPLEWQAEFQYQFIKVTHYNVITNKTPTDYYPMVNESNDEHRFVILYGISQTLFNQNKIKAYYTVAGGINNFNFNTLPLFYEYTPTNDDNFKMLTGVFKAEAGIKIKDFNMGIEYMTIPSKVNDFGNYVLKNLSQIRVKMGFILVKKYY
jgi:hypothetical protein